MSEIKVRSDHFFVVRCADGERRHKEGFATLAEAAQWAEWGHCCLAKHTFTLHSHNGHSECDNPELCKRRALTMRRAALTT